MDYVFQTIVSLLVEHLKSKSKEHDEQPKHYLINSFDENKLKELLDRANLILNDRTYEKDSKLLCQLAFTKEEAEIYVDGMNYIHKCQNKQYPSRIEIGNFLSKFKELIDQLSKPLITSQPSGQTSRNDKGENVAKPSSGDCADGDQIIAAPGQLVRKFVLFLSTFPERYVFNWNRITRLAATYGVAPGIRVEELPLIEVVDRCWEPNAVPFHFQIGNDVKNLCLTWPENNNCCRFMRDAYEEINKKEESAEIIKKEESAEIIKKEESVEITEKLNEEILSSLVLLGRNTPDPLRLEKRNFYLLKILTIRIIGLTDAEPLKKLLLLRYLDLKHTGVADCKWLESLKELEVLDLRYTRVKEIDRKYLKTLKKLKHLLLGYIPGKKATPMLLPQVLWGPELKIEKVDRYLPGLGLPSNLETLRAIRRPDYIGANVFPATVIDLYVTGLENEMLKPFWEAVEKCKKLTSLGVATTESGDILTSCPPTLGSQLTRLQVEGRFTECRGLDRFVKLIDLTLISAKLDINEIPALEELVCLRLYRAGAKALQVQDDKFKKLKKLVIGDMKELKKVTVGHNVVTLKLCNLPKLYELTCFETIPLLLKRNDDKGTVPSEWPSLEKCIFLKGIGISEDNVRFHKSPHVKMYRYDKEKQSYELK